VALDAADVALEVAVVGDELEHAASMTKVRSTEPIRTTPLNFTQRRTRE
jgi:uncharacterized MnhB-related membrane protein